MQNLFLALFLDVLLGEAPNRLHPVCFLGHWATACETWFRRCLSSTPFWAGLLATLAVVLPFAGIAAGFTTLAGLLGPGFMQVAAALVIYVCLAPRSLSEHAAAVAIPLAHGDLDAARTAVSRMVGRDVQEMDAFAVGRACVESVGENLVDGVLATIFWAGVGQILCGPTGAATLAALHRAANTLDAMWGRRNERYCRFGTVAARLDDVLGWLPARLSLPVIALAAALVSLMSGTRKAPVSVETSETPPTSETPSTPETPRPPVVRLDGRSALRFGWRDRAAHASPNSAWSEAAFAGALGLRLGGPDTYAGKVRETPYLGDEHATPNATPQHIRAAVMLMWASTLLSALLAALTIILVSR